MTGTGSLTVAAVQMVSENNDPEGNRDRAARLVQDAAKQGARLILLPEFMPNGYIYSAELWDTAETKSGPTLQWMRNIARRLNIWLGAGFLEASGQDFYNTFVITNPDGKVDGCVRKQRPALAEAFFTKGHVGPRVIHTQLGKIGVGICFENQRAFMPGLIFAQEADLLLMPHSAPTFTLGRLLSARDIHMYEQLIRNLAQTYASVLGIPVVLANKSGPWCSPLPLLPLSFQQSRFPGFSSIVDSDQTLKAQLEAEQGVIVADVTLDSNAKIHQPPRCAGKWIGPVPFAYRLIDLYETLGFISYRFSYRRRKRAREIIAQD